MGASKTAVKAVLFDLDDTLYDHLHSARHGLVAMSQRHTAMQNIAVRELEDRYSTALETIHVRLLRGEVTQREARVTRMQSLFASYDLEVDEQQAIDEYTQFRADYDSVCEPVRGSRELLDRLKQDGVRLAVVTNNLVTEQIPKLRQLQMDKYFEVVSISEEVGVPKPDRKIYDVTLERLSLSVDDVVMVGDSLTSDIAGAVNVGMRAVWLKRHPELPDTPPQGIATIESDFRDVDLAMRQIIGLR